MSEQLEQWALCWSGAGGENFHVEKVEWMLDSNRRAFVQGRTSTYVPIAFGTLDEVSAAADKLRPVMHKRQKAAA